MSHDRRVISFVLTFEPRTIFSVSLFLAILSVWLNIPQIAVEDACGGAVWNYVIDRRLVNVIHGSTGHTVHPDTYLHYQILN